MINGTAFNIAFKEWKFYRHELDLLQSKDFMECPTCAVYQHSVYVDGNVKLYQYQSLLKRNPPGNIVLARC